MKINRTIIWKAISRKLATVLLITVSAAAFATLGDGKSKGKKASLLNKKMIVTPGKFSLKSGYQYRGSQIVNQQRAYNTITLNSVVTYQKGHMTYIVPMKTTINSQKIKLSIGVPNQKN